MLEWFERAIDNPDYDPESDPDALNEEYVCDVCGCTFTLEEAIDVYRRRVDASYRVCGHAGDLCGNCAADKYERETEIL